MSLNVQIKTSTIINLLQRKNTKYKVYSIKPYNTWQRRDYSRVSPISSTNKTIHWTEYWWKGR